MVDHFTGLQVVLCREEASWTPMKADAPTHESEA